MSAMNTNRQGGLVSGKIAKNIEKLSSGYRINRAADDAAGLAISEKMRRQIRGLTQASANTQDGVSFCQIADGALDEVHNMMKRCKELAIKAANGTEMDTDRAYIQMEIGEIIKEVDRIHNTAEFNEIKVFSSEGADPDRAPELQGAGYNIEVTWEFVDPSGRKVSGPASVTSSGSNSNNNTALGDFVVKAATDAATELKRLYPNLIGAASSSGVKIGLNIGYIDGVGSTLASARLELATAGGSSATAYTLNIDTSDYSVAGFSSMTDAQKADLAATVAHEMTHLVMYDTLTNNMLSGHSDSFPKWLVEGMAQTSSGDNGWLSGRISPSSSDGEIKSYMSQIKSMPYGAGYLATMVLGAAAGGGATSSAIASGLDKILTPIANKSKSIDEAIKDATGGKYNGLKDFENKFASGDAATLTLAKNILSARGTSGGGSLFGALSDTEASVFAEANLTGTTPDYAVDKSATKFYNYFGVEFEFPEIINGGNGITLQVGADAGNTIELTQFNVSAQALFAGAGVDVTTQEMAQNSLDVIDGADARVSKVRAYYGAMQNRLEHTISNLDNVIENTTAAESVIRDTDMAKEMVAFSNNNIIRQAAEAMLAQANQTNQGVLSLLS